MSCKKGSKTKKHLLSAKLITHNTAPCAFCKRDVDDEIIYGKLYSIGDLQCHYFCVLLSCCLVQRGKDDEGLFGFLYPDILAEIERSKKHKCSYCGKEGATLGCSVSKCRKQFHLPCGRERDAVTLFYGNYKTFCNKHAPRQSLTDEIMVRAKERMLAERKMKKRIEKEMVVSDGLSETQNCQEQEAQKPEAEYVCVICYEAVEPYPCVRTFWPPCCARDAWFHRSCVQRMALSAGMHYLKCPLCNQKETFYNAVLSQGYYIPDRDAAWELEQNAFSEIYERSIICSATECQCHKGRDYDTDTGPWVIKLCILCGSVGVHAHCAGEGALARWGGGGDRYVCVTCAPAAPDDLDRLAQNIDAVILQEETSAPTPHRGPVMPSRMSLRRTKQRMLAQRQATSSSYATDSTQLESDDTLNSNTTSSRLELNLKTPKKPEKNIIEPRILSKIENTLISPLKLLEQGLLEKIGQVGALDVQLDSDKLVDQMREKFKRPKPLVEKKKIVNNILEGLFDNIFKEQSKSKEPIKEWVSPKKLPDIDIKAIEENCKENEASKVNIKAEELVVEELDDINHQSQTDSPKKDEEDINVDVTGENSNLDVNNKQMNGESEGCFEKDEIETQDESSSSTFQLPPEFIAEENSNDSLAIFDSPKKPKPVHVQKDLSMEISENDEIVNIDVIKMDEHCFKSDFMRNLNLKSPVKINKCAFKFSPTNKEVLQKNNVDIDVESFKNQYLNEVDREFKSNCSHSQVDGKQTEDTLSSDIIVPEKVHPNKEGEKKKKQKAYKRKLPVQESVLAKKKRFQKNANKSLFLEYKKRDSKIEVKCSQEDSNTKEVKSVDVMVKDMKSQRKSKKHKTKLSIKTKNIQVKIKWRKEQLKLKLTGMKKRRAKKEESKILRQYVLNCSPDSSTKDIITRPMHNVTPIKRKHVKKDGTPDSLVQTSIESFFRIKSSPT